MALKNLPDNLVFYDGDCGFCNSSVQFILAKNKIPFYFMPLQSKSAEAVLKELDITINMDTIYFLKYNKIYDRSSAALRISKGLKGGYPILFAFYIIPKFLRDPFYNFIAKRRHKMKADYCVISTPENDQYFIKD